METEELLTPYTHANTYSWLISTSNVLALDVQNMLIRGTWIRLEKFPKNFLSSKNFTYYISFILELFLQIWRYQSFEGSGKFCWHYPQLSTNTALNDKYSMKCARMISRYKETFRYFSPIYLQHWMNWRPSNFGGISNWKRCFEKCQNWVNVCTNEA